MWQCLVERLSLVVAGAFLSFAFSLSVSNSYCNRKCHGIPLNRRMTPQIKTLLMHLLKFQSISLFLPKSHILHLLFVCASKGANGLKLVSSLSGFFLVFSFKAELNGWYNLSVWQTQSISFPIYLFVVERKVSWPKSECSECVAVSCKVFQRVAHCCRNTVLWSVAILVAVWYRVLLFVEKWCYSMLNCPASTPSFISWLLL